MKRKGGYIAFLIFIALFIPMLYVHVIEWHHGYVDNAFLGELMNTIARTGKPNIQINASVYDLFTFLADSPHEVLARDLSGPIPSTINQFKKHTYFILYPISPLTFLVPDSIIIAGLKVLSFLGILFSFFFALRKKQIDILSVIIATIFISAHPVWSHGIYGQMYVDRIFMFLGFLFLLRLSTTDVKKSSLILLSILCASINDRVGAICGVAILSYVILYYKEADKKGFFTILAVSLIAFSLSIMKLYLDNSDYVSFSSSLNLHNFLQSYLTNPHFSFQLHKFLILNLVLFGIIAIFDWRALLISLGTMLPNIIGSIGGAEKVGWTTHYHSMYFPFLLWAIYRGYSNLYLIAKNKFKYKGVVVVNILVVALTLITLYQYPYYTHTKNPLFNHALSRTVIELPRYTKSGDRYQAILIGDELSKYIPKGSVVSTVEPLFTRLYKDREIHVYPAGIDRADFVVIPITSSTPKYIGAASYRTAEEQTVLNTGLVERLGKLGFNIETPQIVAGYAILKKLS